MAKRTIIVAVILAFLGSSLLMMTSCAKQKTLKEEQGKPKPPVTVTEVKQEPVKQVAEEDQAAMERKRQEEAVRKLQMEVQAFESGNIYFDFDKSDLKPEARAILEKKAAWLKAHPEFAVRIEGHCDERGTNEYNLTLGERRAHKAMKYLNALGISANMLSTVSYGEERPADFGHNEDAWAKNRRDEFKLIK